MTSLRKPTRSDGLRPSPLRWSIANLLAGVMLGLCWHLNLLLRLWRTTMIQGRGIRAIASTFFGNNNGMLCWPSTKHPVLGLPRTWHRICIKGNPDAIALDGVSFLLDSKSSALHNCSFTSLLTCASTREMLACSPLTPLRRGVLAKRVVDGKRMQSLAPSDPWCGSNTESPPEERRCNGQRGSNGTSNLPLPRFAFWPVGTHCLPEALFSVVSLGTETL